MRNVMQEQDVTDWKERLAAYTPETEQERRDWNEILLAAEQYDTQLLYRSHAESHFTCSGFVMNPAMDQVLMVYHRIYDSFAWTGGHADGSSDFLWTAVREAKEETGIQKPFSRWTFSLSKHIRKRAFPFRHISTITSPTASLPTRKKRCGSSRTKTLRYSGSLWNSCRKSAKSPTCCRSMKK